MALDRAAPIYNGRDEDLRRVAEYENYLREQVVHELELLYRKIGELEKALAEK